MNKQYFLIHDHKILYEILFELKSILSFELRFIKEKDLAENVQSKYRWNKCDAIPKWRPDKSLRDIWNGKTFEKLREECIDGNLKNSECMYCINSIIYFFY